ncbi:PAS/PAC sensor signal transduction histidine kinase [Dehalogenimonas lykanthroporepellens BL-DC-9]|nr:PAS/PAC sensor signal transduction histidine kinase [Dehalogenimonas lykanthroporepellens BL-DC-9]
MLDNVPDAVILWRYQGPGLSFIITAVNRTACDRFGYSAEEMVGMPDKDLNAPDSYINIGNITGLLLEKGQAVYEMTHLSRDGRRIPAEVAGRFVEINGVRMAVSVIRDISERKQMELRSMRLNSFPLANPNPVLRATPEGEVVFANSSSTPLLKFWNVDIDGILPPPWPNILNEVFVAGHPDTIELDCNGQVFSMTMAPASQDRFINIYPLDITERKKMELEIRDNRDFLEQLNDSLPETVFNLDSDFVISYVNRQVDKMYGYQPQECLGRSMAFLFRNQKEYEHFKDSLKIESGNRQVVSFSDFWHRRRDGSEFPCEIIMTVAPRPDGSAAAVIIVRDTSERQRAQMEIENYQHHLEDMVLERTRELETEISSRLKAEQELRRLFEREKALSAELKKQIEERQLFTRGLVHELKTPLTPLITASEYLEQHLTDKTAREFARNIRTGAHNMEKRVNEMLDLAKGEIGTLNVQNSRFDLVELVSLTAEFMKPEADRRGLELVTTLPPDPVEIEADPDRLRQVMSNLLGNSIKFTKRGGRIEIATGSSEHSVFIRVTDNGAGIAEADLPYLFQAYHRGQTSEKSRMSGLGLGLTLSRMIVELHGGRIDLDSKKGQGTTFTITLPMNNKGDNPDENIDSRR